MVGCDAMCRRIINDVRLREKDPGTPSGPGLVQSVTGSTYDVRHNLTAANVAGMKFGGVS